MPSDVPCPNQDCPHRDYLRRSNDTGIQVILQAISGLEKSTAAQTLEINQRLGRMESGLARAASRVERHSGEIEALQEIDKSRVDKKMVLVAAFIGSASTLVAGALGMFKSGR